MFKHVATAFGQSVAWHCSQAVPLGSGTQSFSWIVCPLTEIELSAQYVVLDEQLASQKSVQ